MRYFGTFVYMSDAPPGSWDVVETSELAGVRLAWMRQRSGEEGRGHLLVVSPLDGESGNEERLGPYDRKQANMVFEAVQASLLVAAAQQRSRLRGIMDRRSRAKAILDRKKG